MPSLKTWMTGSPISIGAEASLSEAVVVMSDHHFRHLPVVNEAGELVGVLALEDIRAALGSSVTHKTPPPLEVRQEALEWKVSEVMSDSPVVAREGESLADAADRMADAQVGCLPIVDARRHVVGIFSETDALRALATAAWSDQLAAAEPPESGEPDA